MPESLESSSSSESAATESAATESVSSESERVLERGELLLERLAREAEAARAEARRAELEQVLNEARRRGDPQQLKRWLDQYDQLRGDMPMTAAVPVQHRSDNRSGAVTSAGVSLITQRVVNCEHNSRSEQGVRPEAAVSSETVPSSDSVVPAPHLMLSPPAAQVAVASPQSSVAADARGAIPSEQKLSGFPRKSAARATETRREKSPAKRPDVKPESQVAHRSKPSESLAAKVDPAQLKEQQQKQQQELEQQRRQAKLRGMAVSLVLHVLLVILLALLAIKLPEPPASLAFESSSSEAIESFEMTESLEVTAPEDVSETVPTPETSVELTDNLSDLSASLTSDLATGLSAPTTGSATAAIAALAAGSVNPAALQAASSFFGADASGNNFCYVIDSSGSMRGGAWEAAKGELLRSLLTLKESQRFYVIFFNAELAAIPLPGESQPAPNALYATPDNIAHAGRWIETVSIETGASPMRALEAAVKLEPDAIYLLTDGVTSVDVPKKVREFNRTTDLINGEQVMVPIHAIAYYSLKGEQLMRQLAAENNGQFIYVPDPRKLDPRQPANRK